jgi:hypothetical protein
MHRLDHQDRDQTRREQGGFLRCLFGPSSAEIWRQLAEELRGRFEKGGLLRSSRVVANTGEWTVTLDTVNINKHLYTRIRAPYVNADGFRFHVFRKHLFSPIAEFFGFQDLLIGDPVFDDAFVIRGNSEPRLRQLLGKPEIRQLVHAQPHISLRVKDDEGWFGAAFPAGVDELYFLTPGVIRDLERLHQLFELFAQVLHQLCHIGSAYENDPNVTL